MAAGGVGSVDNKEAEVGIAEGASVRESSKRGTEFLVGTCNAVIFLF